MEDTRPRRFSEAAARKPERRLDSRLAEGNHDPDEDRNPDAV